MRQIRLFAAAGVSVALLAACAAKSVEELKASPGATHTSTHPGKVSEIYAVVLRNMRQCFDGRVLYASPERRAHHQFWKGNPEDLLLQHVDGFLDTNSGRATISLRQDPKTVLSTPIYHIHVEMTQKGSNVELAVSAQHWVAGSKPAHDRTVAWINGATGCSYPKSSN